MKIKAGWFLGFAMAASLCVAEPAKVPYIQLKTGEHLEVRAVRALDAGGNLEFVNGDGTFVLSRRLYDYAEILCPEDVRAAEKLLIDKQPGKAVEAFAALADKYRFLGWENFCQYNRMRGMVQLNRVEEALALGEKVSAAENHGDQELQNRWRCRRLLADLYRRLEKTDKALATLREIASDCQDDEIALGAYNQEGDILLQRKNPGEALLAYMRPVVMFDREVSGREYALRQVVKLFKEQNDKRGEKFAAMLEKEYPEVKSEKK